MIDYISMAESSIDLAVFAFTNRDLADEILDAHQRGVAVRILTDDEQMKHKGAAPQRLADGGIPVRTDNSKRYHMHHKFMVVDNLYLVTGSFNWSVQAVKFNQENVLVIDDIYYVNKYA